MRRLGWLALVVLGLGMAQSATAQEFWDKKSYKEWSKDQVKKMLQDSPWASHAGAVDVQTVAFTSSSSQGQDSEQKIDYYAQIRSALPVRQAIIRRAMIDNKYDKMAPADKKLFDSSAEQYLARVYPDVIVITVEYGSNVETVDRELARYWQSAASSEIMVNIYLIGQKGIRIHPTAYQAETGAGRAFQLLFPRTVDGVPVLGSDIKSLKLELPAPSFDTARERSATSATADNGRSNPNANTSRGLKESRTFFEFKVDKMTFKGELVY